MMRNTVILLVLPLLAVACAKDGHEILYKGTALGSMEKNVVVGAEAGQVTMAVISNEEYTISTRSTWAQAPATSQGRDGFTVVYEANEGAVRTAEFYLSIGSTHKDTLYLTQRGLYPPILSFVQPSVVLDGAAAGSKRMGVQTNLTLDQIAMNVVFPENTQPWLNDVVFSGNSLSFRFDANPSAEQLRSANIRFLYKDDEGAEQERVLYISQKTSSNTEGTSISWEDLRSRATTAPTVITDNLVLEGVVVSNKASGNMGNPTQTSVIGIDYTVADRTVYMQSLDGSKGIRILCVGAEDNIFRQFDRVHLMLKGMSLYKENVAGAEYYCLDGMKSFNVFSDESGARPVKTRKIAELTDDDIFTYVTLEEVELPIRKGPLTPVNEKFTNASGVNKVTKFPLIVRDVEGSSLYLYTNMSCLYRRDGHRLPYGSGSLSGVVVSELYSRFAWADDPAGDEDFCGKIGKYQLRHTALSDFSMASSMDDSFSKVLAEWRYITSANQVQYFATDGDKTAWFGHSSTNNITLYDDFSYLGPVGTKSGVFGYHPENINGLGVILADGTDWMAPGYTGTNSSHLNKVNNTSSGMGCGISPSNIGASWYTNVNFTSGTRDPQGLVLHFSAEGVHKAMSLQLCMMSVKVSSYETSGPRDFTLAYSLDGGAQWTSFASFRLPDYSPASPVTQLWQTIGFMPMSFQLPAACLGQADVQLRIFPDATSVLGDDLHYISTLSPTTTVPRTAFNYIGIRYNK